MAEAAVRPAELVVRRVGRIGYEEALHLQRRLVEEVLGGGPDTLLLLEHDPVFTVGRDGREGNLLVPFRALAGLGIAYFETDRGGDITYHGPGQLVGYPVLDLRRHRKDVRWFVSRVEDVLMRTLGSFGLEASTSEDMRGVYVGAAKIGAIGIHVSRWVTSHGFALNVGGDLRPFDYINPCGVAGAPVTSVGRELGGRAPAMEKVMAAAERAFHEVFGHG